MLSKIITYEGCCVDYLQSSMSQMFTHMFRYSTCMVISILTSHHFIGFGISFYVLQEGGNPSR